MRPCNNSYTNAQPVDQVLPNLEIKRKFRSTAEVGHLTHHSLHLTQPIVVSRDKWLLLIVHCQLCPFLLL